MPSSLGRALGRGEWLGSRTFCFKSANRISETIISILREKDGKEKEMENEMFRVGLAITAGVDDDESSSSVLENGEMGIRKKRRVK